MTRTSHRRRAALCAVVSLAAALLQLSALGIGSAQRPPDGPPAPGTGHQVSAPLPAPADLPPPSGLFRARITIAYPADRARLDKLGAVVLSEVKGAALVMADRDQLEALARLRYEPRDISDVALLTAANTGGKAWVGTALSPLVERSTRTHQQRAAGGSISATALSDLRAAMRGLSSEQRAGLATLVTVSSDGDDLTDTEEAWFCTDPNVTDSDGDGVSDSAEVALLKDWLGNRRGGPPSSGAPFRG